jgi:serine/threonine-protein kinase
MPERDSLVGETVGNYRILKSLGVGGMGVVYLGENPEIESKVAIKVLLPGYVSNPKITKRFLDEARAVNRIGHQGIVRIHDCGRQEGLGVYLVMEYLEGRNLKDRLHEEGVFSPEVVVRLVRQVTSALIASHEAGIIHRDLKPANIFVIPDPDMPGGERVKILDFGIAKLLEEREPLDEGTKTGMVLGSPLFMSPEQCIDPKRVDRRTDIYSLGAIAYHLLTSAYPYEADTLGKLILKHQRGRPAPLREQNPAIPEALERVILRSLRTDPQQRYASMQELRDALDRFTTSTGETASPADLPATLINTASTPPRAPMTSTTLSGTAGEKRQLLARRNSRGLVAAAIGVAGIVVAVVTITALRDPSPEPAVGTSDAARGLAAAPGATPGSRPSRPEPASAPASTPAPASVTPSPAPKVRIVLKVTPKGARVRLDGRPLREPTVVLERSGRSHDLRVEAPGYEPQASPLVADGDKTIEIALKRVPRPPPARKMEVKKTNKKTKRTKGERQDTKSRQDKQEKGPYFDDDDL